MDAALTVAVSPNGTYVYVTGVLSDSIAVVDVTVPRSPTVVGGSITQDSTNMDVASGAAMSRDGLHLYVAGQVSDSLAVVDVCDRSEHSDGAGSITQVEFAAARNYLLRLVLRPRHTSVVWIDSDLMAFPEDALFLLQRTGISMRLN